jgi:1,4-dihydroxy-2-naphthoate octaprenyltransferase
VAPFFLAGVLLVFFYNWPLKHYGMGEPTVLVVWGPLMVGGGYASIVGEWSWYVAMISVPYALGPTAVLFGKHIDKIPWDRPRGVRTFPVLVGERVARYLTIALVAGQYAGVAALVLYRFENWPLLISFAAAPFLKDLVPTFLDAPPEAPPPRFPPEVWPLWYSAFAFVHARRFGLLYLAGVALTVVIL